MQRVLIVKTSSLGDILQAFPVLPLIKRHFPGALIDWAVEEKCQELVKANPYVDKALVVNTHKWRKAPFSKAVRSDVKAFLKQLKERKYDVLFDLQGNTKSSLITFLAKADKKIGFDKKNVAEWPNLLATNCKVSPDSNSVRDAYLSLIRKYFNFKRDEKLDVSIELKLQESDLEAIKKIDSEGAYILCPGSAWPNKKLSSEQWQSVLKNIDAKFLVLWGAPLEMFEAEALENAFSGKVKKLPRLSLPALQRLMKSSKGVISMDSLPLHLAESAGVPSFGLFGPSSAKKYAPLPIASKPALTQTVQGSCPYGESFDKRCAKLRTCKTGACLKELNTEMIAEKLNAWMQSIF